MKRIILFLSIIITSVICALSASAQLQFIDADGNPVTATELSFSEVEEDMWGDLQIALPVSVQNTSDAPVNATATITVETITNGTLQTCAFGDCSRYKTAGTYQRPTLTLAAGAVHDMLTEWLPTDYGKCVITITLRDADSGAALSSLRITFLNVDPTAIPSVTTTSKHTLFYSLTGHPQTRITKGFLISQGRKIYVR